MVDTSLRQPLIISHNNKNISQTYSTSNFGRFTNMSGGRI